MEGEVVFENEKWDKRNTNIRVTYIHIEPMVKHWVEGTIESHLILIK
jgi:hypothetical protein